MISPFQQKGHDEVMCGLMPFACTSVHRLAACEPVQGGLQHVDPDHVYMIGGTLLLWLWAAGRTRRGRAGLCCAHPSDDGLLNLPDMLLL